MTILPEFYIGVVDPKHRYNSRKRIDKKIRKQLRTNINKLYDIHIRQQKNKQVRLCRELFRTGKLHTLETVYYRQKCILIDDMMKKAREGK